MLLLLVLTPSDSAYGLAEKQADRPLMKMVLGKGGPPKLARPAWDPCLTQSVFY